jgi:hypothetical protein
MRTALLLRQQVPPDKERITFDRLADVDDMWIWLFKSLCTKLGIEHAQIWMWGGGPREVVYEPWLIERWWPEFPLTPKFDFILSRGGFPEYIPVMQANALAYKVYYGAIYKPRYNPRANQDATKYNLLLADSQKQFSELTEAGYSVAKFRKPAAENIFYPHECEKKYDVVFIGNMNQPSKGHEWFIKRIAGSGFSVLFIGAVNLSIVGLARSAGLGECSFAGYVPRKEIRLLASQAKVGVVCSEGDSCPRIIPELLAMNIPIVIKQSENLYFWEDLLESSSVASADDYTFVDVLKGHVRQYTKFEPREFYISHYSLDVSSSILAVIIQKSLKKTAGRTP